MKIKQILTAEPGLYSATPQYPNGVEDQSLPRKYHLVVLFALIETPHGDMVWPMRRSDIALSCGKYRYLTDVKEIESRSYYLTTKVPADAVVYR